MKFFEFNDYEYYALIVADGEELKGLKNKN